MIMKKMYEMNPLTTSLDHTKHLTYLIGIGTVLVVELYIDFLFRLHSVFNKLEQAMSKRINTADMDINDHYNRDNLSQGKHSSFLNWFVTLFSAVTSIVCC